MERDGGGSGYTAVAFSSVNQHGLPFLPLAPVPALPSVLCVSLSAKAWPDFTFYGLE